LPDALTAPAPACTPASAPVPPDGTAPAPAPASGPAPAPGSAAPPTGRTTGTGHPHEDRGPDENNRPCEDGRRIWADLGRGRTRALFARADPRYGYDPVLMRQVLTELDARASLGATLSVCVQVSNALPLLLADRSGAQGRSGAVAEELLDGTSRIAVAATDAAAPGSDLAALGTTVRFDGGHAVLDGGKRWVVGATTADWALVLARHAPGRRFTSFTLLLVPLDAPGVTRRAAGTGTFRGAGIGDLTFTGVRLAPGCVVGGRGRGLALFARQLAGERLAGALWAQALVGRVLAATRSTLGSRQVAGAALWQHPAVRQRYAEAVVSHQGLQALCERMCAPGADAAQAVDATAAQAAVVKAAAAQCVESVLSTCAYLCGADGFRAEGLQQLRAEAAMFGVAGGTTPLLLDLIADHAEVIVPGRLAEPASPAEPAPSAGPAGPAAPTGPAAAAAPPGAGR
jgi:alkylation response protein AidB-like acyl-CoA dehydrogenase